MLVSFVIPHYNLPRELLQRCIASIVAQKTAREEYEIVVVDDGSDTPPEWINNEPVAANIRLITTTNGGPGAARNRGIDEAKGEYIQFIDADDSLVPDSYANCIRLLKSEKPDILQHCYRMCDNDEQMQQHPAIDHETKMHACGADYVSRNNLSGSPCTYIFKRALTTDHSIRFAERVLHEDEDFNLKIYHYGKKLIVSKYIIYNYYRRSNSITSSSNAAHEEKRINDLFRLLKRVVDFRAESKPECTPTQLAALDRKLSMLTVDTLLNLFYNGKSAKEIEAICHDRLRPLGLYPLPQKSHSFKYRFFASLSSNSTGLKILRAILPSHKPLKK